MPRRCSVRIVGVAVALALAPMALAEETDMAEQAEDTQEAESKPSGREMRLAGGPEAILVERNAESLGLDAKTVAAVKVLAEEARGSADKNRDEFQGAVRKMNELLADDLPNGEALDRQADVIARVWGSGLKSRLHMSLQVRELLTAEQRRKLAELRRQPQRQPQRRPAPKGALAPPMGPAPAIAPPTGR